jgi:hypothetical protein
MSEEKIVLPTKPTKAVLDEPTRVIFMGMPKIGKTTATARLPEALVINFEDEQQTASGMFLYCPTIKKLKEICNAVKKAGKPYLFGVIDTITKMEELAEAEAERIYMSRLVGKNWIKVIGTPQGKKLDPTCGKAQYGRILGLPNGSGYPFLTEAMKGIDKLLKETFPHVIYLSHVKDTHLKNEDTGVETTSMDVNLTGKNKQVFSADAQAIGYFERIDMELYLKFTPSTDLISGCKVDRLADKTIKICEKTEDGKFITYWEEIFPSIKKK